MDVYEALAVAEEVGRREKAAQRDWSPHKPTEKQAEFLGLDCREALYGGQAGGGKSDALLMGALEYVNQPGFAALLFRRTHKDLALPGALMDRSKEWLANSGAHWNGTDKQWTFPSGATITFGYLDTEAHKFRYQSSEFQYIAFDELTQFTETQYTYLLSRLRRLKGSTIPLRMRSASNPGGVGHEWVKKRFVDGDKTFVPAGLSDNPHIDQEEYEASLLAMKDGDPTAYKQLAEGLWIQDSQGLVYRYDDSINGVDSMPDFYKPKNEGWYHAIVVDLGASEVKPTTSFTTLAWHAKHDDVWVKESYKKAGMIPSTIAAEVKPKLKAHRNAVVVMDQGALGKGYIGEFRQRYTIPVREARKQDKLGYRKLMNGDLATGNTKVVRSQCTDLLEEYGNLLWNDKGTDNEKGADNHCSDGALYGWREAKHWLENREEEKPKPRRRYENDVTGSVDGSRVV